MIAQEIERETQRLFEDIHAQLENQGALKYEQQVQAIVAQQIEGIYNIDFEPF